MGETSPVVVVATLVPVAGREDEVERALRVAVAATHEQDEGCELYALHRVVRGTAGFVVVEKWASAELLAQHGSGAAFAELTKRLDGLLAEPLGVSVLDPLPAGQAGLGSL
ncbi:putative quinol monooxygenase [Pseudonocardia sp. RS010]|uniref:putative quinol monooxygenase n=1 Tax=Pseudonocardia sp. RS010 TaxID=3385979 RepID=UPI0039A1280E